MRGGRVSAVAHETRAVRNLATVRESSNWNEGGPW